jgi:hypothetical protein
MNTLQVAKFLLLMAIAGVLALAAVISRPLAERLARFFDRWAQDLEGMAVAYVVTAQKSTQLTDLDKTPSVKQSADTYYGKLRVLRFDFTQAGAGDINSTVDLVKLPAGRVTLFGSLSRVGHDALGAARTLDVGWTAYTEPDGDAVAADEDGLHSAADVSAAGSFNPSDELGNDAAHQFWSKEGVLLQAKVEGGTIPDLAKLNGHFVIAVE